MLIYGLAVGRVFRDAIADGDDFRLRFMDGMEIVCAWGDLGPEVKAWSRNVVSADMDLHPQFRYVTGKRVRSVLTDGETLLLEFTDGHVLRSRFKTAPQVEGVDVSVQLECPGLFGDAASPRIGVSKVVGVR